MLTLVTGLPGHGKTLYTLWHVEQLRLSSGRQVFYSGIPDLKLPWIELADPEKWFECPDGAIIVIDEAQRIFPVRDARAVVPEKCRQFETHRHRGHDVVLITQDAMLVDHHVRRLVGQYYVIHRPYGQLTAVVWEFQRVCDWKDHTERQGALRRPFRYPKDFYEKYRSATIHTVKRRVPWPLLALPVLLVGVVALGWFAFSSIDPRDSGDDTASSSNGLPVPVKYGGSVPLASPKEWILAGLPRLADFPESAPRYDGIVKVKDFPRVAACVASSSRCSCYSQQGTVVPVSASFCADFVVKGRFDPYIEAHERRSVPLNSRESPAPSPVDTTSSQGPQPYVVINPPLPGK